MSRSVLELRPLRKARAGRNPNAKVRTMITANTTPQEVVQAPQKLLGRSARAVVAGLLTVILLSTLVDVVLHATAVFPPWGETMSDALFVLASSYRLLIGVLGGYVTARLAPHRPMRHALVLGGIGFLLSLAGTLATAGRGPEFGPLWYPLLLVATAVPCSWAGAKIFTRR